MILGNTDLDWGAPAQMTAMPKKLKQAGYATHMVGKWHVGFQSPAMTPHGRGFDTSFGYFDGAEDHWTQASCDSPACNEPSLAGDSVYDPFGFNGNSVDLYCTDRPCFGRNG